MNLKMIVSVVAVLAVMVTGSVATADYVRTTADGNGADSFVRQDNSTNNYGTEASLTAKSYRKSYAKFDISTWNDSTTVTSATFELTWAYLTWGQATTGLVKLYAVDDDVTGGDTWGESTITWDNAPGNAADNGVNPDDTTWVGEMSWSAIPADGTTLSVNLNTAAKVKFINDSLGVGGDDLVTLLVVYKEHTGANSNIQWASKEYTPTGGSQGDWAPELTLVPEPATMTLLLLGLPFALRRRR